MIKNLIYSLQNRWNDSLYWKMRFYCQRHNNILQICMIFLLRRIENGINASTGLGLNTRSSPMVLMESPLILPHRLNNIIIGRICRFGKKVAIYQNVTISEADRSKLTIIEDNMLIRADAVILNNAHIGKCAKIGTNCLLISDILQGGVCVGNPGKVVKVIKQ